MQFLSPTNNSHWQTYKQLELIPDSIPNPYARVSTFKFGLNHAWRSLLSLLVDELVTEQQVEYIERCWALNEFGQRDKSASNPLQRLWVLMN